MMHDEGSRLRLGPAPNQKPNGVGLVRVILHASRPGDVLARAKAVLSSIVQLEPARFNETAAQHLPEWFIAACTPQPTQDEQEQWLAWWRTLDHKSKATAERERGWTLQEWLSWMEPDQRTWWWWDAEVTGPTTAIVHVTVEGWPSALGALHWLLAASGADDSQPDDQCST